MELENPPAHWIDFEARDRICAESAAHSHYQKLKATSALLISLLTKLIRKNLIHDFLDTDLQEWMNDNFPRTDLDWQKGVAAQTKTDSFVIANDLDGCKAISTELNGKYSDIRFAYVGKTMLVDFGNGTIMRIT